MKQRIDAGTSMRCFCALAGLTGCDSNEKSLRSAGFKTPIITARRVARAPRAPLLAHYNKSNRKRKRYGF
mgnify:FL=1